MKRKSSIVFYLFLILMVLGLMACSTTPNVKITEDKIYDKIPPSSLPEYLLGPGDQLEVFFNFETKPTTELYRLAVGDIIRVEFNYHRELNRDLTVQPDGRIMLPFEGEILAVDLTSSELDETITELFSKQFKNPVVTVTLIQFNQSRVEFQRAIRSDGRGQSRLVKIRPDGIINFPLIRDIKAAGLTIPELRDIVTEQYIEKLDNIEISLILVEANSNLVYVLGEVARPDFFKMEAPTTVSQILSRARINMATAELRTILVISRTKDNRPIGRIFNFEEVLSHGNIGKDFLLQQYDVVFVPQNKITKAGLFVNQYINQLVPLFFRTNLGFVYNLNE